MVLGVRLLISLLGSGGATNLAGEDATIPNTDDLKDENTGLFLLTDFETSFWLELFFCYKHITYIKPYLHGHVPLQFTTNFSLHTLQTTYELPVIVL